MSRAELAHEIGVSPSQIANFVREYGATKRPKSESFLVPMHELAIRQPPEKIINPSVREICAAYRETLPLEMLADTDTQPVYRTTEYTLIQGGDDVAKEARLTILSSEKASKAKLELSTFADTKLILEGAAVPTSSTLTAMLSDTRNNRMITLHLARTELPGCFNGLIVQSNLAGQTSVGRVVAFDDAELLDSMGHLNESEKDKLAEKIFRKNEELDIEGSYANQ